MTPDLARRLFASSSYKGGSGQFDQVQGYNRGQVTGFGALDMFMGAGPNRKYTPYGRQLGGSGSGSTGMHLTPEVMTTTAAGSPTQFRAPDAGMMSFFGHGADSMKQLQAPASSMKQLQALGGGR